jgi:diguanylate cyclase (GGDEF)-like protein
MVVTTTERRPLQYFEGRVRLHGLWRTNGDDMTQPRKRSNEFAAPVDQDQAGPDVAEAGHASDPLRGPGALARMRYADERDEAARLRDLSAWARDCATHAMERAATRHEAALENGASPDAVIAALTDAVAEARARAASDRERAAGDRLEAAEDRLRAANDRRRARVDLRSAHLDDLTGVYTRGVGLHMLRQEIARSHRSGEPLVLTFLDVDGLKQINDRQGHAAGDAVLRALGAALRSKVRSHDPIVRVGGDEFVCAFTNTGLQAAAARFRELEAALRDARVGASISGGFAELRPGESLEELTARGDAELYRIKHARLPSPTRLERDASRAK